MAAEDKGDSETAQMFARVGRAITRWSLVEQTLSNIFTLCVAPFGARIGPDDVYISYLDHEVPTAIFYSIESFRGKLGLVDAALLARIKDHGTWADNIRSDWARLHDKTRRLSLKRNRLAHWTVLPGFDDGEEFHEPRLMPPYGSPAWWQETGASPQGLKMSPAHLDHLYTAFSILDGRLRAFLKILAANERLSDKYDRLMARQIQSQGRLNPTRGERIARYLASRDLLEKGA
jgi:hypothetical protein